MWSECSSKESKPRRTLFAEIDTDGDGFITREELTADHLGRGGTEEEANEEFDQLDTDKDGKLSE